ncbi:MAG: tripartite tricarboxylate transporter TctB family protein [Nitratireductor sp.]
MKLKTLKQLFQRYRRPGNLFFATLFLAGSLFLVSQLSVQTQWRAGTKMSAQPALWPIISLVGMTIFAAFNWISSVSSPRIPGRWEEVAYWVRSIEYVLWFMAYVAMVPLLGYLPSSIIFAVTLAVRCGYRDARMLLAAALVAVVIVLLFKTFLQVRIPAGMVYDYLPAVLRKFMLTNF